MALLNKSNIVTGNIVQATDVNQIVDALAHSGSYDILISGSVSIGTGSVNPNFKTFIVGNLGVRGTISSSAVTGAFLGNGSGITGIITSSYSLTSSVSLNSLASISSSYALTSSYAASSSIANASISSSYALTASYAMNGGGAGGTLSGSGAPGYHAIWQNTNSYLISSSFVSESATNLFILGPATFSSSIDTTGSIRTQGFVSASSIIARGAGITGSSFYQSSSVGYSILTNGSGSFSGTVDASAFYQNSLRILKDNIKSFDEDALIILNGVNVVTFNFKKHPGQLKIGFIADDTHKYLSTDEHNVMDVNNTIGLLIKAIQQLSKENEELKYRISKLENNI